MRLKLPLYVFVFFFCLLFLTGCTSQDNKNSSLELVKEGLELYEDREYKKSMDKFVLALDKYPANADAYMGLLDVFLDKGLLDESKDLAEEAEARLSKDDAAKIYAKIGDKYYEGREYDEAEGMYKNALGTEAGVIGLGKVEVQKGDISEAAKRFKGGGDNAEFLLLSAYLTLDDWAKGGKIVAEMDLNTIEDESIKEQVSRLREIYTIDDEDVLYKNTSLAGEYVNAGYPTLAIKMLNEYMEEIEEYPDGQYFLGRAYLDSGEYDSAVEALEKAITLEIQEPEAYVALARAQLFKKETEKALDIYKEAIAFVDPENSSDIVQEYVDVLIENNMMNAAKALLTDMVAQKDTVWMQIMLAQISYAQKDLVKMSEVLRRLENESNMTQAETRNFVRYQLLYEMEDVKDEARVNALIERYIVFDRHNPEIFLFKGKLSVYKSDLQGAKEAFERAIELDLDGVVSKEATKLLATLN